MAKRPIKNKISYFQVGSSFAFGETFLILSIFIGPLKNFL